MRTMSWMRMSIRSIYIYDVVQELAEDWWLVIESRDLHKEWHMSLASTYKNKNPITKAVIMWVVKESNDAVLKTLQ